ncbi:MAG TPA: hypothetical protein VGL81_23960 [Polyangiaceae bacterium]|jgi:DNA-directed RNA polymerase specialized sigma24 family protein
MKKALLVSGPPSDPSTPTPPPGGPTDRSDREPMLRDAALRAAIGKVLGGRVPDADVEDLVWETLQEAYEAKKLPPPGHERTDYVLAIGRNKGIDFHKAAQFKPQLTLAGDEADRLVAAATDPVAARDMLDKVAREVGHTTTLRWYARVTFLGESVADIAREAGLKYDTVVKRVKAMEKRVHAVGLRVAAGTFLLALAAAVWSLAKPQPPVVVPELPVPSVRPADSTEHPEPNAKTQAEKLRQEAFGQCMRNDWPSCEQGLNEAQALDPQGEAEDARVRAARDDIQVGSTLKPGSRWKPKEPRVYAPEKR